MPKPLFDVPLEQMTSIRVRRSSSSSMRSLSFQSESRITRPCCIRTLLYRLLGWKTNLEISVPIVFPSGLVDKLRDQTERHELDDLCLEITKLDRIQQAAE